MSEGRFDIQLGHLREYWVEYVVLKARFNFLMFTPYVVAIVTYVIMGNIWASAWMYIVTRVVRIIRLRDSGGQIKVSRWLGQMRGYRASFIEALEEETGENWFPYRQGVRTTKKRADGGHLILKIPFVGAEDDEAVVVTSTKSGSERQVFPTVEAFIEWLGQPA